MFALVTAIGTTVLGLTIANARGGDVTEYTARFTDASGLLKGDDVRIAGVVVGSVTDAHRRPADRRGRVRRRLLDAAARIGERDAQVQEPSSAALRRARPGRRPDRRDAAGRRADPARTHPARAEPDGAVQRLPTACSRA
ncbi:MCE family protein [Pseudonocardia sp. MCCB 268]|nr:MCE family protein [Pseudonocardia cytotoxica]